MVRPTGIEPVSRASETLILSIELRSRSAKKGYFANYPRYNAQELDILRN
ncbi:MAG: hypothetical protein RIS03_871 [Pseudomonadota bacterium]